MNNKQQLEQARLHLIEQARATNSPVFMACLEEYLAKQQEWIERNTKETTETKVTPHDIAFPDVLNMQQLRFTGTHEHDKWPVDDQTFRAETDQGILEVKVVDGKMESIVLLGTTDAPTQQTDKIQPYVSKDLQKVMETIKPVYLKMQSDLINNGIYATDVLETGKKDEPVSEPTMAQLAQWLQAFKFKSGNRVSDSLSDENFLDHANRHLRQILGIVKFNDLDKFREILLNTIFTFIEKYTAMGWDFDLDSKVFNQHVMDTKVFTKKELSLFKEINSKVGIDIEISHVEPTAQDAFLVKASRNNHCVDINGILENSLIAKIPNTTLVLPIIDKYAKRIYVEISDSSPSYQIDFTKVGRIAILPPQFVWNYDNINFENLFNDPAYVEFLVYDMTIDSEAKAIFGCLCGTGRPDKTELLRDQDERTIRVSGQYSRSMFVVEIFEN